MNRQQIEMIYEANGLSDYRLKSLEDLKKCHGIDAFCVSGYDDLEEEHKEIFKRFIVKYFNSNGMGLKMCTVPISINYVEDIDYIAPDPRGLEDDDYKNVVVSIVRKINVINANGKKKQLHKYQDAEYKGIKPTKENRSEYLRFEFREGKSKTWLHVTHNGEQWF
jgi:hypothetical protein